MQKNSTIRKQLMYLGVVLILNMTWVSPLGAQKRHIVEPDKKPVQYGVASFYSSNFNGHKTASGEVFSNTKLTAASNHFPIGTFVRVRNLHNKKSVIVKINDRMHYANSRAIDLTHTAAKQLGMIRRGITRVKVEVIPPMFYTFFGVSPESFLLAVDR